LVQSQLCCPTGCGYNICLNNVEHTPASVKFVEMREDFEPKLAIALPHPLTANTKTFRGNGEEALPRLSQPLLDPSELPRTEASLLV
jgi:hypothetical protein